MSLWLLLRLALVDLLQHKFRSLLATLGIIFGVASIQAMVSISDGARTETMARIEAMGVSNVMVRSIKPAREQAAGGQSQGQRQYVAEFGLKRRDVEHVRETFPGIKRMVAYRDMRAQMENAGGKPVDVRVLATEPAFVELTGSIMERGRFLTITDNDEAQRVCVLGARAARRLLAYEDPLQSVVRIRSQWYRVVGVISNPAGLKVSGSDDIEQHVFVPLQTAWRLEGDQTFSADQGTYEAVRVEVDGLIVQTESREWVIDTAARLKHYLETTHKVVDYEVTVPLELMKQAEATQRIFTIVMSSIGGISLLVGGIGILNIMLANVYERRKQIGIHRAIGARRVDVLLMFLSQAITLTSVGGLLGLAAGYYLAQAVSHFAGWPVVFSVWALGLGLGVSLLAGVVFGMWPAYHAAKVSPVQALRSE